MLLRPTTLRVLRNVYKMSDRFVSVYTDTSASHEFCELLIKRPQTVMF